MFHLLDLDGMPILEQLQLEERLLRTDDRNWCLINRGSPPAIVMGISGKPEELLHLDRVDIPVVKRFSGGGTVVVDEDTLFVTFIGHPDLLDGPCYPEQIMRWSAQFFPVELCENDFIVGNQKVGGNAQYIRRNRWLHHTSFLWDYSPERMALLKAPKRQPKYRAQRDHSSFLSRLSDHFPSPEAFLAKLHSELPLTPAAPPNSDIFHRKTTHMIPNLQPLKGG